MIKLGVDAVNPKLHKYANQILTGKKLDTVVTMKNGTTKTLGRLKEIIEKNSDILDKGQFSRVESFLKEGTEDMIDNASMKMAQKFNPLSRDNALLKAGRKVGSYSENEAKLVNIISNLREGKSIKEAVKIADETLFNYGKLTTAERTFFKRVIPFYTFARKNAELQMWALTHKPGIVKAQLTGIKNASELGDGLSEEDKEGLPDFVLQNLGIKAGMNKHGQSMFHTGFGLPIEEFLNRFTGSDSIPANFVKDILGQTNPLIKYPLEKATGVDFFSGRPLAELDNADGLKAFLDVLPDKVSKELKEVLQFSEGEKNIYVNGKVVGKKESATANPFALHFLRSLPSSRIMNTTKYLTSDDGMTINPLIKFFSGVSSWTIDKERQEYFKDLDEKKELKEYLIRMGLIYDFNITAVNKR